MSFLSLIVLTFTLLFSPGQTQAQANNQQFRGFWISQTEIDQLPTHNPTWDRIVKIANSDIGAADISDQNYDHPIDTMAIALAYAKTGDDSYRQKTVTELMEVIGTENNNDPNCDHTRKDRPAGARSLAIGRNLAPYVIASDIINFRSGGYDPDGQGTEFENWVDYIRFRDNCPDNGSGSYPDDNWYNLSQTHNSSVSNGNTMTGGSRIVAAAYLGDQEELNRAWLTYKQYTGDTSSDIIDRYNSYSTTWRVMSSPVIGINPKNSTLNNISVDGVLPNDQGRGGSLPDNSNTEPGYTQYPWEGLQGSFVQAVVFDRLGYSHNGSNPWQINDSALLRAVEYQWYLQQKFGGKWFDSTRAAWVKHLANVAYGKDYPVAAYNGGRNMDWTQWTHMNQIKFDTISPSLRGDANQDDLVDEIDYDIWLSYYLQSTSLGSQVGDFNLDGLVNGIDYAIWRNDYR